MTVLRNLFWPSIITHSKQLRYMNAESMGMAQSKSHGTALFLALDCYAVSFAAGWLCEESIQCSMYETVNMLYLVPLIDADLGSSSENKKQKYLCYVCWLCLWIRANKSKLFKKHFRKADELLNPRALKFSYVNKIHMFQCMGKIFCVEFQRVTLKFHTKYLTHYLWHTLKDASFIHHCIHNF